ncbi:MAG: hypothetical protein AB7G23_09410 [Vicinamibacterales bacterium]
MGMLALAAAAALCFSLGGLFMKQADGLRLLAPGVAFLLLFALGAVLQSYAMRGTGLAVTYVMVLGLEAAIATGLAVGLLGEPMSAVKAGGIVLTLVGIAVMRTA